MPKSPNRHRIWLMPITILLCVAIFIVVKQKKDVAMTTVKAGFPPMGELSKGQKETLGNFARNFAGLLREGKSEEAASMFDNAALLQRTLAGVVIPTKAYGNFVSGALKGMDTRGAGLFAALLNGNFDFLRITDTTGEPELLFRFVSDKGFDYYRFKFDFLGENDAPRMTDFYNFNGGEYASQSMRRAVLPLILEMGGQLADGSGMSVNDELFLESMEKIQELTGHIQTGETYLALKLLNELPAPLLNERFVRGMELQVLSGMPEKEKEYIAAMENLMKTFPDDPSLKLLMLDFYRLKKDTKKVFALLDEIEAEVGVDPYHEILRGSLYLVEKDYANAQKSAWSAISADSTVKEAWLIILDAGLKGNDHRSVASALSAMHSDFGLELGKSAYNDPIYQEFFKSPEGKAFKAILEGGEATEILKDLGTL
jgi:hypothetical protein